ncbi:MAG: thioredoxin family protein [Planctomycetota bacterium]|nr:thioredoxin family protein [Planctomycetota bacterium]
MNVSFAPVNAPEGREALLKIELIVPEGRHTYSTNKNFSGGTKITINAVKGITPIDTEFVADHKPKLEYEPLFSKTVEKYKGRVTWTRRFKIDPEISPDDAGLVFYFRFQTCNSTNCKNKTIFYQATLSDITTIKSLKFATLAGATPYQEPDAPAPTVIDDADVTAGTNDPFFSDLQFVDDEAGGDLAWFLFSAFIGGMILNVMPCVLPVLAIKILSFVQQAGESRLRIFLLNLSYTGGVLSVFLLLATLAVTVNLGWGGLFQNSDFNLVMACLVFAMGLSLLGVFEIPVPGFVGSAAGNSQQQEGLAGAFLTGIFATLLATPCSGPFLGATLGWSVSQPTEITYLIWGTMGLGMAFPYLLFGMFPFAIKWLPKPGMWMVRFKEFSGFVLMGTVIFLMNSLQEEYTMPLLIMLLGISLGLWMIGNLYDVTSHIRHVWTVRGSALVLTALICGYGYNMTRHAGLKLPWREFTHATLKEELKSGKTVLVDFTADWCLTCKTVEKFALNTSDTLNFVNEHDVVTLMADYTQESPEIKAWLDRFQSKSVPLTVVFPASDYKRPIVIRDVYTKSKLLSKLDQAVNRAASADAKTSTASEPTAARM